VNTVKHAADAIIQVEQASYLEALEPTRDPILTEMEAFARANHHPISDPEVASFLAVVAGSMRPKRIVEIGTNIGYGAIVLARAAPGSRVETIELSADLCKIARDFIARANLSDRIEVREGAALAELDRCTPGVDLFYVDCVKEEYPAYLERILPRLSPAGVIVADNVLWQGLVAKKDVPADQLKRVTALREFNRALMASPNLRSVILPLGDGVAFAVRNG
jgi:predicted O-methyltransferase YrrM